MNAWEKYLQEVEETKALLPLIEEKTFFQKVEKALELLNQAALNGKPILVCGNGGSAADAEHITGELVGKFLKQRRPINAISLSTNPAVVTAWSNDVDYASVFARQVEAHAQAGGVLWAISTSGNSENVVQAALTAKKCGMSVVGMTGKGGGKLGEQCDALMDVPCPSTPRIQEIHLILYHFLCARIEETIAI